MKDKKSIDFLKPVFLNDLVRIGRDNDGGYVINKRILSKTRILIGLGIFNDWSFERHFLHESSGAKAYLFDFSTGQPLKLHHRIMEIIVRKTKGSILRLSEFIKIRVLRRHIQGEELPSYLDFFASFFRKKNNNTWIKEFKKDFSKGGVMYGKAIFIPKHISRDVDDKSRMSVKNVFKMIGEKEEVSKDSIFVKMDIELDEYNILPELMNYKDSINGLVVEFHDLDVRWDEFSSLIADMKKTYVITHAHANNDCGLVEETAIPKMIELTFLKAHFLDGEDRVSSNSVSYPIQRLDQRNIKCKDDIVLNFD